MQLKLDWPLGVGVTIPNVTAIPKRLVIEQGGMGSSLQFAAVDGAGTPLAWSTIPIPAEQVEQLIASYLQPILAVVMAQPSESFVSQGLPDFSKAQIVEEKS